MKKKYHIIIMSLLGLLSMINRCYAQQEFQYTQYMYNTVAINPAYAGTRGVLSLSSIFRSQWVGLNGAPRTMQLSAHGSLYSNRIGLGFSASNDIIGPSSETTISTDYSYTIRLSRDTKLSLGLKAGWNFYNVDFNKLNIKDPDDPSMEGNVNTNAPVFGFGAYFHGDSWYAGISVPNTLESKHYDEFTLTTVSKKAHIYIISGYIFDINRDWTFKPAIMIKGTSGAPVSIDLSSNFLYLEKFTFGASYRWNNSISGLLGFQASDKVMIGYAYDYDTTELGNYNSGSHELFLRFELTSNKNLMHPRFF